RRGMSQFELAQATGCTKDTVSRWERGKSRRVRSHLRKPLCAALRITWERLTRPTEQPEDLAADVTTRVAIGNDAWASLLVVAVRYNVRPRDILDVAPLLFLIVAERSLLERKRRLREINAIVQEKEEKLLENCAHLGGIIAARSLSADSQLYEEEESLSKRDVFVRFIKYQNWNEGDA
ncbi:MAG: helix-turn-helix transcriptional regulator, partial [Acidimicrobiia bacterium]|nr:helix-turn-helix transcriptional regulator [Acidimicrobiia bacterium]